MAPMASKRTESVQSNSSPPPANITSCLPHWINSAALPMQWALVEQAELMEYDRPLILNHVDSTAEQVDDIARGTWNGPTRFGPLAGSRAVSADCTMARVDGPPEPMIRPVRSLTMSRSSNPESRSACSMARKL